MKMFSIIVFFALMGLTYQADWSYEYETQWPGICRTGQQQSPINIMSRDAVLDEHGSHIRGPLVFRGYGSVNVSAQNNGHTVKWNAVPNTQPPVLSGGPLRGNYTFMQFHIHWLSEHAIDGMKYPLEVHMVHMKTGLKLEEALQRPDGLAVIGVLFQVRSDRDSYYAMEEITPVLPDLTHKTDKDLPSKVIDISRLFSSEPQSYYTYHGSLTTPMCQEVVTWIVMDKPLSISDTQYRLFSKIDVGGVNNYRSLQPANRVVYRSIPSCSSIASPHFLGSLVSLLSCSTSILVAAFGKGVCVITNMKKRIFGDNLKDCAKSIN